MRKGLFIIAFVITNLHSFAQESLLPLMPEKDSVRMAAERQVLYHQLLSGSLLTGIQPDLPKLPDFDLNSELFRRWTYSVSSNDWSADRWNSGYFRLTGSPFLRNEMITSGSTYRLNDRFSFGGYSFRAQSALSAPFPNQGLNNFDIHGSSLFLQYNVSKNFKIETHFNVSHGAGL
ncbi:MAG: hypothetical protein WCY58_10995 [Mariniphaga sp.]